MGKRFFWAGLSLAFVGACVTRTTAACPGCDGTETGVSEPADTPRADTSLPEDTGTTDGPDDSSSGDSAAPAFCSNHTRAVTDPATTITVYLHGFSTNLSSSDTYGTPLATMSELGVGLTAFAGLPLGTEDPTAPDQYVELEYYGGEAPDYYDAADIAEVDLVTSVPRYSLITAKAIRHLVETVPGATGVNILCHSMGCLIARHMIENDVGGVASDGLIPRWTTISGTLTGADLANFFVTYKDIAAMIGLSPEDIDAQTYAWVEKNVAVYDGVRLEGNNPIFCDMLVHHVAATDPSVESFLGAEFLELSNAGDNPNDGILWTDDESFHAMAEAATYETSTGDHVASSLTVLNRDHFTIEDDPGTWATTAATLSGDRRMTIVLRQITLADDLEADDALDFSHAGTAPAELVPEVSVSWPSLALAGYASSVVHEERRDTRMAPSFACEQGKPITLDHVLYDSPVLSDVDTVELHLDLREVDWYPRFGIQENALLPDEQVGEVTLDLPVASDTWSGRVGTADVTLEITVQTLW